MARAAPFWTNACHAHGPHADRASADCLRTARSIARGHRVPAPRPKRGRARNQAHPLVARGPRGVNGVWPSWRSDRRGFGRMPVCQRRPHWVCPGRAGWLPDRRTGWRPIREARLLNGGSMRTSISLAVLLGTACVSAPAAPPSGSGISVRYASSPGTLLVRNTMPTGLDVRAYLNVHPSMPQPLGGLLRLGAVGPNSSACVQIPDSVIISGTVVGSGQTTTITWTSSDTLWLTGVDTTVGVQSGGETSEFVPSSSSGWSVTLPASGNAPAASSQCGA